VFSATIGFEYCTVFPGSTGGRNAKSGQGGVDEGDKKKDQTIAVHDFGGGTFDI
jgi:hypothetical protein